MHCALSDSLLVNLKNTIWILIPSRGRKIKKLLFSFSNIKMLVNKDDSKTIRSGFVRLRKLMKLADYGIQIGSS